MAEENDSIRDKIRGDIQATTAAELLPHHRRGALLIVAPQTDLLSVAIAVANDDKASVQQFLADKSMYKSILVEITDWCVEESTRLQYVILQPYVLAQRIVTHDKTLR